MADPRAYFAPGPGARWRFAEGDVLVWAETETGDTWVLKRADLNPQTDAPAKSETLVAEGNPRFPSVVYDSAGNLRVAG